MPIEQLCLWTPINFMASFTLCDKLYETAAQHKTVGHLSFSVWQQRREQTAYSPRKRWYIIEFISKHPDIEMFFKWQEVMNVWEVYGVAMAAVCHSDEVSSLVLVVVLQFSYAPVSTLLLSALCCFPVFPRLITLRNPSSCLVMSERRLRWAEIGR